MGSKLQRDSLAATKAVMVCLHCIALCDLLPQLKAQSLATVEYRVVGSVLGVSPAVLSVPKGIAGSVQMTLTGATNVTASVYVEAIIRGPSFPARRIVGPVNQPLLLPALPLVGDYQLDNIRLVDSATGETKLEAT